jgi:hypothetical protein
MFLTIRIEAVNIDTSTCEIDTEVDTVAVVMHTLVWTVSGSLPLDIDQKGSFQRIQGDIMDSKVSILFMHLCEHIK